MAPIIGVEWVVLTTVYVTLLHVFRNSPTILGLSEPAPEYCEGRRDEDTVCNRTDLFAFQASSGIALTTCAILGFHTWHISRKAHTALPATPQGRLFGYLQEAELLAALNFGFQFWDFVISLTIAEHSTTLMLGHHLMASTVSWCSIQYELLHYYGIFFLGVTEVSSIFLVFVDLAKYFPPLPDTAFDAFVRWGCAPLFIVAFLYYRVYLWWPESYRLFRDVQRVVASGDAKRQRPGATWVLYLFLALNLPLGVLQLYWVSVIVEESQKALAQ